MHGSSKENLYILLVLFLGALFQCKIHYLDSAIFFDFEQTFKKGGIFSVFLQECGTGMQSPCTKFF